MSAQVIACPKTAEAPGQAGGLGVAAARPHAGRLRRATAWIMWDRMLSLHKARGVGAGYMRTQLAEIERERGFLLSAKHGPTIEVEAELRQWLVSWQIWLACEGADPTDDRS